MHVPGFNKLQHPRVLIPIRMLERTLNPVVFMYLSKAEEEMGLVINIEAFNG